MKHLRNVSVRGVVGTCFLLAFCFGTALLCGCAVFSSSNAGNVLDTPDKRNVASMALFAQGVAIQKEEQAKGTNGNISLCLEPLRLAFQLQPDNEKLFRQYTYACHEANAYTDGLHAIETWIDFNKDEDADLHLDAAGFAERAHLYKEAAKHCDVYQKYCNGTNRELAVEQIRLQFLSHEDRKALRLAKEQIEKWNDATAQVIPVEWAVQFAERDQTPERALPCMELALQYTPATNKHLRTTLLLFKAQCELGCDKRDKALETFKDAKANNPRDIRPDQMLGETIAENPGTWKKIDKETYEQYASSFGRLVFAYALVKWAEKEEGLQRWQYLSKAVTLMDQVRQGEPKDFFLKEFYIGFLSAYTSLLDVQSSLSPLPEGSAKFCRSELNELAKESLALHPGSPELMNFLAYEWSLQGTNLEQAHELVNKAIRIDSDNAAYLDTKGWVLHKMGRDYQALQWLMKAGELNKDPEIMGHIVDVLRALGRNEEADICEKTLQEQTSGK